MSVNNESVYKTTTTTVINNEKEREKNESFFQKLKNNITNKPFKKIYRLCIFILIALVMNNTNGNHVTDLLSNAIKQNMCENSTGITLTSITDQYLMD